MEATVASTKRALLTCVFLKSRTGSELHTLEMAQQLMAHGYEVTCFTLLSAYPLIDDFLEAGVRVVTFEQADTLGDHYDLFFAQHHLVSDYVWNCLDISFDRVVVSVLGAASEHELLPTFIASADLAVFVSQECLDAYAGELPRGLATMVLPNYASRAFFELEPRKRPQDIERIAVISNHTPPEVRGLRDVVPAGVDITYFGYESLSVPITPQLLDSFDVVISIDRTAQLCMATNTPFYCYDVFGGPGWLGLTSLKVHAQRNFSGRSDPTKRTAQELWADLEGGYADAVAHSRALRRYVRRHGAFETLFENLMAELERSPRSICPSHTQDLSLGERCARECSRLYDDFSQHSAEFTEVQLFYGNRVDPCLEERSVLLRVRLNSLVTIHYQHVIPDNPDFYPLRVDPSPLPCECLMRTPGLVAQPAVPVLDDGWEVLDVPDPSYAYPRELTNEQHQQPITFAVRPLASTSRDTSGTQPIP